jgi:hypothetical protein
MSGLMILHGCRTLQLTRGFNTLIDEADFDTVGRSKWYAHETKYAFYAARRIMGLGSKTGVFTYLHRYLVDAPPKTDVDHKNGDCLDNRGNNLRVLDRTRNMQNSRRSCGKSRFKGVGAAWKEGNWTARIRVDGIVIHLGTHPSQENAAKAYDDAAVKYFGEFACTNKDIYGDY